MSSSQQSEPPVTVSHTENPASDAPAPTVFRIPALALSGVALFLFGVTFPVVGAPQWFGWMLALPILLAYYIIRVRTTVTTRGVVSRRAVGSTSVEWSSVTGLVFPRLGWGRATLDDGTSVRLPGVTVDSLPALSKASGGAVPDPSPVAEPGTPADSDTGDGADGADEDAGAAENARPE